VNSFILFRGRERRKTIKKEKVRKERGPLEEQAGREIEMSQDVTRSKREKSMKIYRRKSTGKNEAAGTKKKRRRGTPKLHVREKSRGKKSSKKIAKAERKKRGDRGNTWGSLRKTQKLIIQKRS